MNILNLSLKQLSDKLESKELSSVEIVNAYINSSKLSQELNIYITTTFDEALVSAKLSDERRANKKQLSVYDGIPLGIKDIFLTKGIRATNGSRILSDFIAPYESTVTQNLKNQGFICLGKLNMDEFAMGSGNLTSYFGPVINPWKAQDNKNLVPGGSSGGSSAGVASRAFVAALGTDTGGSIRQPASFTGIVGLKPTYGVCSRFGIIAFASSLDQAGPMTRNVQDNAILLNSMAGYDSNDASMVKFDKPDYTKDLYKGVKGLKIGIPKEYFSDKLSANIKDYWNKTAKILESQGAQIVDISLPHTNYALAVYYIVAPAEASSNLSRFDGVRYGIREQAKDLADVYLNSRTQGWGEEVRRRILLGTYNLLTENYAKYIQATKLRRLITNDFISAFNKVDLILTPTTTSSAFPIDESPKDPLEMYFNDIFTVTANLAGLPAMSIPVGLCEKGLPIGMQLIGNYHQEPKLYNASFALEQEIKFAELSNFVKENKLF